MKRTMTALAALTLVVAACSGGDDASSDDAADTSSEATSEATADQPDADTSDDTADGQAPTDEASDEMSDADTSDEMSDGDETTDEASDEPSDDATVDDDEPSGPEIRTIDDVPEPCREAMANFLREIEPIVEPIEWQSATIADFEQIALQFEEKAADFETASVEIGCDDLNFADDDSSEILIDFAQIEAPGAVGFLEFLEELSTGLPTVVDDPATDDIATCQDAIDFLQGLIDEYDSIESVPASELLKIPSIANLYGDCTVEQLEFFDNPELAEFMGG